MGRARSPVGPPLNTEAQKAEISFKNGNSRHLFLLLLLFRISKQRQTGRKSGGNNVLGRRSRQLGGPGGIAEGAIVLREFVLCCHTPQTLIAPQSRPPYFSS